jgi:hypothetical protein
MKENVILAVIPAAAVVIILLLKDCISDELRRRRNLPEQVDPTYRARLLTPDWAFYERHLQRPAPAALRELYSDIGLISACESYRGKRQGISCFEPLKEDGLLDTHANIGHNIVPIATSGCGDPIYLKPGVKESDAVYIVFHDDPGNVEVFADSVAVMVQKSRQVNRAS